MTVNAYAAQEAGGKLEPFTYELGELAPDQIDVEVLHCGLCHSDMSMLNNEWRFTQYPFVPGHEIVGRVIAKGALVRHLKVGQAVGVGWNASSCQVCDQCMGGEHQLCNRAQPTIAGRYGGFADKIRVQSQWAISIPEGVDLSKAGPLFCGGITVFSPFLQHNITPLDRVGVVGIGGLGHMALAFAKAWGCEVTAFSTSPEKEAEARKLGAHHFVSTHDKDALKKLSNSFDLIIDTVNVELNWNAYIKTLRPKGVFHIVGVASEVKARVGGLMAKQAAISASPTGSPIQMRQMIDFCARHSIEPMVEAYKMSDVNQALDRLENGKPRYRIVLSN
ncbi:MAG: NAD(P)-dependent alcohol dehydrogenase [Saprospiraceae bacterium]